MKRLMMMLVALAGCRTGNLSFTCNADSQCGPGGICVQNQCGVPAAQCPSGYRIYNDTTCLPPVDGGTGGNGTDCDSSCSGPCAVCDRGECHYQAAGTICAAQLCTNGTLTKTATCDGHGVCSTPTTRACAPYKCLGDGSDCASKCGAEADTCQPPNQCVGASCGLAPNGAKCTGPSDCQSGHCADGYCCNSDCAAGCVACNLTGKEGTCSPVAAGGTDPHNLCHADAAATCGHTGTCDGAGACAFYSAGTVCAPASCQAAGYTTAGTCPGGGAPCGGGTSYSCGNYACYMNSGSPQCWSDCGGCLGLPGGGTPPFQNQCAPGKTCTKPSCMNDDTFWRCL